MYHVSAQGVDERTINVHYYYYYYCVAVFSLRSARTGIGVVVVGSGAVVRASSRCLCGWFLSILLALRSW